MQGKSVGEFVDALYYNAEMEITYHKQRLIVTGYLENGIYSICVDTISASSKRLFEVSSDDRSKCIEAFEKARIFDGLTIYEAERDIEVLYG